MQWVCLPCGSAVEVVDPNSRVNQNAQFEGCGKSGGRIGQVIFALAGGEMLNA